MPHKVVGPIPECPECCPFCLHADCADPEICPGTFLSSLIILQKAKRWHNFDIFTAARKCSVDCKPVLVCPRCSSAVLCKDR